MQLFKLLEITEAGAHAIEESQPLVNTIDERLQIILIASLFFSFCAIWAWRMGFFQLPPQRHSITKIEWRDVLAAFILFMLIELTVIPLGPILANLFQSNNISLDNILNLSSKTEISQSWSNILSICLTTLGLVTYTWLIDISKRQIIWGRVENFQKFIKDLMTGCLSWLLAYPLVVAIGQTVAVILLLFLHNGDVDVDQVAVKHLRNTFPFTGLFIITSLVIVFLVPIAEELLFRGFLQNWLKQKLGFPLALFLTAFIFTTFHFSTSQGLGNVELLTSLFILACFLGFLYEKRQSLWASIGLHATFNAVSILVIHGIQS